MSEVPNRFNSFRRIRTVKELFSCLLKIVLAANLCVAVPMLASGNAPSISCHGVFAPEERPLENTDIMSIMNLLFFSIKGGGAKQSTNSPNRYFEEIWKSTQFVTYLHSKNLEYPVEASFEQKYQLIARYMADGMSSFRNESYLAPLQDKTLADALKLHGVEIPPDDSGYTALKKLSKSNVSRLLKKDFKIFKDPSIPEAQAAVNNLELLFVHNSHIMFEKPGFPILSPANLENLGLEKFGASSQNFNRLLGSDHHVYFWVKFKRRDTFSTPGSEYGRMGVILNNTYAKTHAWISPFIMHPFELYSFTKTHSPKVAENLKNALGIEETKDGFSMNYYSGGDIAKAEIQAAEAQLSEFDFTPQDYELLVKSRVLIKLKKYKELNNGTYENALSELSSLDQERVTRAMHSLGIEEAEAKVPVAVPESHVTHFTAHE